MVGKRTYLLFILAPPAMLSLTALGGLIGGGLPASFAPWPFLIGLLVSGLPHGAVDLRISQQLRQQSGIQAITGFLWYIAIMFAAAGGLLLSPRLMLVCFGLLTVWHFGRADERDLIDAGSGPQRTRAYRCLWSVARGSTIILLPFWFAPEQTLDVVGRLLRFCGDTQPLALPHLTTVTSLVLTASLAVQVHSIVQRGQNRQISVAIQESVELAALWAAFASLHPLFAMGLYYLTWHSWRHLRRLNPVLNGRSVWDVRLSGLLRVHVDSLILLLPTLAAVFMLALWRIGSLDPINVTLASLLVYVVVTLPHEIMCSQLFPKPRSLPRRGVISRAAESTVSKKALLMRAPVAGIDARPRPEPPAAADQISNIHSKLTCESFSSACHSESSTC